jgi:hypothetical protein
VPHGAAFAAVWEPPALRAVSVYISTSLQSLLASQALSQALAHTALQALLAAWTLPSYAASALSLIDAPWAVASARADEAGRLLAEALLAGVHGARRPVSLLGYGLGARLVFACATRIAQAAAAAAAAPRRTAGAAAAAAAGAAPRRTAGEAAAAAEEEEEEEAAGASSSTAAFRLPKAGAVDPSGLLHDVVLLGAPLPADPAAWAAVRRVAAGRVISGYSCGDMVLRLVYRSAALRWQVAGLGPIGHPTTAPTMAAEAAAAAAAAPAPAPAALSPEAPPSPRATAGAASPAAAAAAAAAPTLASATTLLDGVESVDLSHLVDGHPRVVARANPEEWKRELGLTDEELALAQTLGSKYASLAKKEMKTDPLVSSP